MPAEAILHEPMKALANTGASPGAHSALACLISGVNGLANEPRKSNPALVREVDKAIEDLRSVRTRFF